VIEGLEKNLSNPGFVERAPPETVEEKRAALAEARTHLDKLRATLAELRALVA
jgi:valyl-tRNA synthetase